MTVQEKLQKFVQLLDAAADQLAELSQDEKEIDALLKRWYDHRRRWVRPYMGGRHYVDSPAFQPTWFLLRLDETDGSALHFQDWVCDETEHVYVEVAFLLDPDGWIEQDKKERVTRETWEKQRTRYNEQKRAEALERELERLRAQGYTVEKKVD